MVSYVVGQFHLYLSPGLSLGTMVDTGFGGCEVMSFRYADTSKGQATSSPSSGSKTVREDGGNMFFRSAGIHPPHDASK